MPRLKSPGVAAIEMPARTDVAAVTQISGVQAQTGDRREDVTVTRINRDPTTATAFAVTKKIAGRQRLPEHASVMKGERNRSRTIIAVIVKRSVSATPNIRATANRVHRPNRVLHAVGCVRRRISNSVAQHGAVTMHHRMRIGEIKTRGSCFRIGIVPVNRLRGTDRTRRRVIRNLNCLRALGLSIESERLKRHAVDSLRCKNGSLRTRELRLGTHRK